MHHRGNEPSLPSKKSAPTYGPPGPGSYGAIRDRPAKPVSVRADLLERVRSFAEKSVRIVMGAYVMGAI